MAKNNYVDIEIHLITGDTSLIMVELQLRKKKFQSTVHIHTYNRYNCVYMYS